MANLNDLSVSTNYADFPGKILAITNALAQQLDGTHTGKPNNAIRWSSSDNKWQKWNGSAWGNLSTDYAFTNITATQLKLNDNEYIYLGTNAAAATQLRIFHNGSHAHFDNNTGNTYIDATGNVVLRSDGGDDAVVCTKNEGVHLHWRGASSAGEKFKTIETGIEVTGSLSTSTHINCHGYINTAAASATTDSNIKVGTGFPNDRNGNSYIDFIGDSAYDTYGLRIVRNSGGTAGNSVSGITHRGTGSLTIQAEDAGSIALRTNGSDALYVDSTQQIGIGTTNPTETLTVFGSGAGKATVLIEGESSADAHINFLVSNATNWSVGIDDSDSDMFKISAHSDLGTNDRFKIATDGTTTFSGGVTATSFTGSLTGNVTGNVSGSSGSCTGNASTASTADKALAVTVVDESTDTTNFILFSTAATGDLAVKSGTNLTFNSSTGLLTATGFSGSGLNLTALNASNISSGTIDRDRLGTDGANTKYLRGDGTWQTIATTDTQLTDEYVQDVVGAMVGDNNETDILVTYNDDSAKLNFAVQKFNNYALLEDRQAHGVVGQALTASAWGERRINAISINEGTIVTQLASNRFTLSQGTYLIKWSFPFYEVKKAITRLKNVDDSAVIESGKSTYQNGYSIAESTGIVKFTITDTKELAIEYFVQETDASTSTAQEGGIVGPEHADQTEDELYGHVEIWKLYA